MVREHLACLFTSAPVAECGREVILPAPVLASSWPLAVLFFAIVGLLGIAFLRAMFRHEIDADREVDEILDTRERRLRRAANDIVDPQTPGA